MSEHTDFRALSFAQLLDRHLRPELTEASALVDAAADLLRRIDRGELPAERLGAVSGALADALVLLAGHVAREHPDLALPGLTAASGRGALLIQGLDSTG